MSRYHRTESRRVGTNTHPTPGCPIAPYAGCIQAEMRSC